MFGAILLCYFLNDNSEIPRCEWENDIKMVPKDRMADCRLDIYDSTGVTGENWSEFWVA
jgi:hypothetical protein